MACSASALLFGLLLPIGFAPQQQVDSGTVSPALNRRVAEAVANQWNVRPDDVELEWGRIRHGESIADDTAFRLLGRGADGWFAVHFEPSARPALAVRLRAAFVDTVPVASRSLAAGVALAAGDIALAELARWGPPTEAGIVPAVGWRVRRAVAAGEPLGRPNIAPPLLVQAGEAVRLVWISRSIHIVIEGVAANDAVLGGEVRVRLSDRRGKARGVVTGRGTADFTGMVTR